jgi:hypothetical protein
VSVYGRAYCARLWSIVITVVCIAGWIVDRDAPRAPPCWVGKHGDHCAAQKADKDNVAVRRSALVKLSKFDPVRDHGCPRQCDRSIAGQLPVAGRALARAGQMRRCFLPSTATEDLTIRPDRSSLVMLDRIF